MTECFVGSVDEAIFNIIIENNMSMKCPFDTGNVIKKIKMLTFSLLTCSLHMVQHLIVLNHVAHRRQKK